MLKRISAIILLVTLFCGSLTACSSDSREIDDDIYPLAIGIDKGTTNKVRITLQYPTYKGGAGASSQGGKGGQSEENQAEGSNIHTIEAASIVEALNLINTAISRTVVLSHAKMLVISEDFAREGIEKYILSTIRFRDFRQTVQVVIVNSTAEAFIHENKTNIGESLSKAVELMFYQGNKNGYFPQVNVDYLYERMLSPYCEPVAIYAGINNFNNLDKIKGNENSPLVIEKNYLPGQLPRSGVAKREFLGTAVFAGEKMVGALNNNETRYFLMITGDFERGIFTILDQQDPTSSVSFDTKLGRRPKISAKFENGKPVIDVKLNIEADVVTIQSRIAYDDKDKFNELNCMLKSYVEAGIKETIEKTQKEYKSDIFGFGFAVAKKFLTLQEFLQYDWLTHYPDAKINVDVVTNIRRTGLKSKSAPVYTNEQNKDGGNQ